MEISTETRDRVFTAADALFEQAGRNGFPTVDAVRKAARVKMSDASAGMREWRRLQATQAVQTASPVPEAVQVALNGAMAVLWRQAQELAGETLRAAQAGWETEREELDTMRQELAEAFERQGAELEAAVATRDAEKAAAEKLSQKLKDAISRAEKAEVRNVEIERRADELRAERDQALEVAAKAREDAATLRGRLEALKAGKSR